MSDIIMAWILVISFAGIGALGFAFAVQLIWEALKMIYTGIKWVVRKLRKEA